MTKQEIWQGGVCKGLVVDSEEAKQRLIEVYGKKPLDSHVSSMVEEESIEFNDPSEEMDLFDWLYVQG